VRVRVAGRLVARRGQGKAAFLDLLDRSGRIQLLARVDVLGEERFELLTGLDLGDIVGIDGEVIRSRRGELSISVEDVTVLAKSLRPPPEKHHGLTDTETRYRHRELDLMANEEARELFVARARAIPGTPIVLAAGAAVGLAVGGAPSGLGLGPQSLSFSLPDHHAFLTALTTLVLAQLPLTFGNSVVATVDAEREYFGLRARRVRAGAVATSIAGMNIFAGLLGGLPMCHGAGGATAHFKLGARTAGATLAAGALFLAFAIAFGASLPSLLEVLAPGALAGMLGFVAIQHGALAMRIERVSERALAALVGLVTLWTGNLAIGFGCGVAVLLARWGWERRRERGAVPRSA
jgi:hypothetical protein